MSSSSSALVLVLVFVLLHSAAAAEPEPLTIPGASTSETYKSASGADLQIWIFNPADHKPSDSRPAIVFFFGGGWTGGSPAQFAPHCRYLASRGIVAATADYRVKSRQGTTPFECVADGKSAVRFLRKNALRLGIDPAIIAAGGGSAGGHVAAATGIVPGLDGPGEDLSISSKPDALVLFNPVYDNGPGGYGHARLGQRWREISPAHHISKNSPPTIVFLGDKDTLIPVATAESFRDKLLAAGVKSELHIYKDQPHGFFNLNKGGPDIFLDTLSKMDSFLAALGFLNGKPTPAQLKSTLD